jgi:hypothetical protein
MDARVRSVLEQAHAFLIRERESHDHGLSLNKLIADLGACLDAQTADGAKPLATYQEAYKFLCECGIEAKQASHVAGRLFPRVTLEMVEQQRKTIELLADNSMRLRKIARDNARVAKGSK